MILEILIKTKHNLDLLIDFFLNFIKIIKNWLTRWSMVKISVLKLNHWMITKNGSVIILMMRKITIVTAHFLENLTSVNMN